MAGGFLFKPPAKISYQTSDTPAVSQCLLPQLLLLASAALRGYLHSVSIHRKERKKILSGVSLSFISFTHLPPAVFWENR
eukprot:scaffold47310_cov43-Cyclotella_meneghiniana.AAC.2